MTQTQSMIYDAFQGQSYILDKLDVQHTPIYDTVTIAAAGVLSSTTASFFSNVGPGSGKTVAQTNLGQNRRLTAPEAFSVFSYRLRIAENVLLADMLTVYNLFAFQFYLGQKYYQRGPVWNYNAGGGINAMTTRTDSSIYTNGTPSREAMHRLAVVLVIGNQAEFYGDLAGDSQTLTAAAAGGTGLRITCLLDGLYARGVQ